MTRETKSLSNIKVRKHSAEEVIENKRPKPEIKIKPSEYYQTQETIENSSSSSDESSNESQTKMAEKNDMTQALIEAFKNKDVKEILHGYCNSVIAETKKEIETLITSEVNKINTKTEDHEDRLLSLEAMADEFDQQKRNHNVIIRGLKTCDDYTKSIENMMNIGQEITANTSDIKYVIKLTMKNEKPGTSSVKVCFHNRRLRDEVYGRRLKLKGTDVFVSEDLTQAKSGLAFTARQYARDTPGVTTWTMDGQIYIKDNEESKPRIIHRPADLKPAPAPPTRSF